MFHKIGKVRKIRKLSEPPERVQGIKRDKIPIRPGPQVGKEDPLEAAALQNSPGSLPERIVWKWLEDGDHVYETQISEFGGRMVAGGSVVDFLVYDLAPSPVVLRVQGDYWHGPQFAERQARDDEQRFRLVMKGYIVVDLWEGDIYVAVEYDRLERYIMEAVADSR